MGKMMEQGPVLIITFQAQLVMVIKNPKGEVVEGDPVSGNQGTGGLGQLLTHRAQACLMSTDLSLESGASGVGEKHHS